MCAVAEKWMSLLRCSKCGRDLLTQNDEGQCKLRTRLILFHGDSVQAMCPHCKALNDVPLVILQKPQQER